MDGKDQTKMGDIEGVTRTLSARLVCRVHKVHQRLKRCGWRSPWWTLWTLRTKFW